MIEVSNIRIPLNSLEGSDTSELALCKREAAKKLGIKTKDINHVELRRRSIDSRKKSHIVLTYTVDVTLSDSPATEKNLLQRLQAHNVRGVKEATATVGFPEIANLKLTQRPVVVGAGCAGLFCALALAHAGLEPLLIERGDDARRRSHAIEKFNAQGDLDPESNIQFGLGGAGTFSDGKLGTGTKSPAHRLILETFVEAGAPREILWDAKPHVGSDLLPTVVTNICRHITELGGEVWLRSKLVDIDLTERGISGLTVERKQAGTTAPHIEHIQASTVVLACGHSARDVFELLKRRNVKLERKTFAMGVRIEHLQSTIDKAQYGPEAGNPLLGAAPYKLVAHIPGGRSAFSFCMCPGGYVVAATSEPGGVVTNGMSLSRRDGINANSGLLANVFPTDLPGDDVLAGISLQRDCEHRAYELGGGTYAAPAQLVGDFLARRPSSGGGEVIPTYPRGVTWGSIDSCLPDYIVDTLRAALPLLGKRLHGFNAPDAVLTAAETRSSSPVRVTRNDSGQSVNTPGLWPCGEGAGYAGGIMSAATDGISTAEKIIAWYNKSNPS